MYSILLVFRSNPSYPLLHIYDSDKVGDYKKLLQHPFPRNVLVRALRDAESKNDAQHDIGSTILLVSFIFHVCVLSFGSLSDYTRWNVEKTFMLRFQSSEFSSKLKKRNSRTTQKPNFLKILNSN